MEIKPTVEALAKDTFAVCKFIGERAVGGAWGALANQVTGEQDGTQQNQ